jgi:hypothetical protein
MSEAIFWGGVVYALGFGLFVKRRRVLDTPTARTVSAAIGRAELCGTAHGEPAQPSLVTGTPCAYWEAELHRRVPNGKGGKTMKRIAMANARIGHFWVEDASGRMPVLVDGAHWWFDGATALRSRGWRRTDTPLTERAQRWVESAAGCRWDAAEFKLVERRLEEGGPVYVLGTLSAADDLLQPVDQRPPPRSVGSAISRGFVDLLFKPAPGDDAVSRAVANVREASDANARVKARAELPPWLLAAENVAVWKGRRGDPFLIADCAENRLAKLLWRWGFITMGLGTALILSGVHELIK